MQRSNSPSQLEIAHQLQLKETEVKKVLNEVAEV